MNLVGKRKGNPFLVAFVRSLEFRLREDGFVMTHAQLAQVATASLDVEPIGAEQVREILRESPLRPLPKSAAAWDTAFAKAGVKSRKPRT